MVKEILHRHLPQ